MMGRSESNFPEELWAAGKIIDNGWRGEDMNEIAEQLVAMWRGYV